MMAKTNPPQRLTDTGLLNDCDQYTQQPLIDSGEDLLVCLEDEGIQKMTLTKIHINRHDKYNSPDIIQGHNVFDILRARNRHLAREKGISICLTRFKVVTADGQNHTLTIGPPDTIRYDGDLAVIHHWLVKRGFVTNQSLIAKNYPGHPRHAFGNCLTCDMTAPP